MQVAAAGTGVRLSDGSTNVVPVGSPEQVRAALALHARLVQRSLERGDDQGWALHPGPLVTGTRRRYDVNLSILFTELPLLERPAAAAAQGFDAVEFWWPFDTAVPTEKDVDAFAAAIGDAGVQLVGLNFFAGNMPGGDRGL